MKIELLEEVDSTNTYIKRYLGGNEDRIVCAKRQTGGKGTKGRSFMSQEGGLYLSILKFYENFPAEKAFRIMAHAAVSVCKTAADFGVAAQIKWPNDVLANGGKLCGILIENVLNGKFVRASVVGIGVNVCNDLTALRRIAVSLSEAAGKKLCVEEVREKLLIHLREEDDFEDYLNLIGFLGQTVHVFAPDGKFLATALRVLENGNLEVSRNGEIMALSAAEITLRLEES